MKRFLFVCLAAIGAVVIGHAQTPLDPAKLLNPGTDSWPSYNGDYSGRRFSTLTKINDKNIGALSLAWIYRVNLGNNGLTEFSPLQYLVNALNSRTYRGVAEPFLLELTRNLGVRRTLYQVLKTGTRDERIYLARALARTGDQETVSYLEALASDSDTEVSQEGARALRTLKARL